MSTTPPQHNPKPPADAEGQIATGTKEENAPAPAGHQSNPNNVSDSVKGDGQRSQIEQIPVDHIEDTTEEPSTNADSSDTTAESIPLPERIPVHVYTEETFGQKLSHWGPTLIGFISIFLTAFVWYNGQKISNQQIELQKQQTKLQEQQTLQQNEQVQAELADIRTKFFDDLTSDDETKKTLAEIGLAGHGQKAMPVIHLALGVEQGEIRDSAVNVFYRLFLAEMKLEGRAQLLQQLMNEFTSPNKYLRIGVVQTLVRIEPLLEPTERQRAISFIETSAPPRDTCSDPEGREVVLEAATFFNLKKTHSTEYLLAVAQHPRCGNAWLQAMIKLGAAATELPPPLRSEVKRRITQLQGEVLGNLRENVSNEDLAAGAGFEQLMKKGQVSISFEELKRRVRVEFGSLIQAFGET